MKTRTRNPGLATLPGFHKQVFVDIGKRWLRALWNCELRGVLAAGFLVRGFLGTIYAHRI
jgi:hypothetical protein